MTHMLNIYYIIYLLIKNCSVVNYNTEMLSLNIIKEIEYEEELKYKTIWD